MNAVEVIEKPDIRDDVVEQSGALFLELLRDIRAYSVYQGSNPEYLNKAKVALGVGGIHAKAVGAQNERQMNEKRVVKALPE